MTRNRSGGYWTPRQHNNRKQADEALAMLYAKSPLMWSARYATIVDPVKGRMPFVPYSYQAKFLMDRDPRRLVLKARQTGFSNVIAIDSVHTALHQPESTQLLVSRNQVLARQLITYAQHTISGMDNPPKLVIENQGELGFDNGARIISLPANPSTGRGFPATKVVLDEFAFCKYDTLIYESVMGTVSTGGSVTISSTPNGRANMYSRIWHGTEGGDWSRHRIHWADCPRYWDPAIQQMTPVFHRIRENLPIESFAQEYDCDFLASGGAVFRSEDLEKLEDGYHGDPDRCNDFVTTWDIGRRHDATVGITLGWDPLSGTWQVVRFERHIGLPYPAIQELINGVFWTQPMTTSVESNGVGDPVIENLSFVPHPFLMTPRSKVQAVQALRLLIEKGRLKLNQKEIRRELDLYEWKDEDLVQDCVMALVQAAAIIEAPVVEETLVEYESPVRISPV